MRILVFGAGAIGTIYGYILSKANNDVVHFVRENRIVQLVNGIKVNILDGREQKRVRRIQDCYHLKMTTHLGTEDRYDLILVSISHGSMGDVLRVLKDSGVQGDILFFNGLWKDYSSVDCMLSRERYCWGYPVAGGNLDYNKAELNGAILDHVILGETNGKMSERLKRLTQLFSQAGLKSEIPDDILHWIWIHMAINAGVISTCLKYGSAASFMNSTKALKEGILSMRETLEIVKARGVPMEKYKNEIRMYYLPASLSALFLRKYFRTNDLSRNIMELHNNKTDLLDLCRDVYATGMDLKIKMPLIHANAGCFLTHEG